MPRQSNDKNQRIDFVFPRDYMELWHLLSVKGDNVELIPKDFDVYPEYDLPYKLLSMINSSDRYDSFEELKGSPGEYNYNPLRFYRHGDGTWRDFLFQLPGIYELLGIKRKLDINIERNHITSKILREIYNNSDDSNGSLMEVFQTPILFLILVEQRISNGAFVPDNIIDLINKAIYSYKNKKMNMFTEDHLEFCYDFFLNTSRNSAFKAWCVGRDLIEFKEMKTEVKTIVNDYIKNTNKKKEKFKHSNEKGATISFPKYMRSIMLGIYERYDCLELILPMVNKNTLWTNTDEMVLKNIEEKTARTFRTFQRYLCYRSEVNNFFDSHETFMEKFEELQEINYKASYESDKKEMEKIDKKQKKLYDLYCKTVEKKLTDYYAFCIYTLYKVSNEEEEYKGIAQDAFERVFSIYLFNKETDLLYGKFEKLEEKMNKEKDIYSKFKLIIFIFNCISNNVIHAIYYSPGVYHRIRLAEHICETKLGINSMEVLYMNNIVDSENDNEQVVSEISDINKDYLMAEKEYIYKWISDKKELTKSDITAKYKSNKENACCNEYNKFYDTIYSKINEVLNKKYTKGKYKKIGKADITRIAKTMLNQMPIEKRILHFWVILFSFVSEDSLIKVHGFE